MIPDILQNEITDLEKVGYQIQLKEVGNKIYIVFKDYKLPKGYNIEKTDLLIWTQTMYPSCAFDMFWANSMLTLENGGVPQASTLDIQDNVRWRRFSIHPYNVKAWNPAEDNLKGFMAYINKRLNTLV